MTRDCHAGICGSRRVRLPPATRQLIFFLPPDDDDDDLEKLSVLKLRVRFSNEMSTRCPIGHCDTAPMRHTFRNECNEANLEPVSDTPTTCPVRFPLQPSCCRTVCTDPYIRLASAYLRDATDRPLPVSHAARDPQVKDTVLLRDCAERTTRRNLVVTVTKLRHMPPRTVEHRAESDNGQMWRRENWTRR